MEGRDARDDDGLVNDNDDDSTDDSDDIDRNDDEGLDDGVQGREDYRSVYPPPLSYVALNHATPPTVMHPMFSPRQ